VQGGVCDRVAVLPLGLHGLEAVPQGQSANDIPSHADDCGPKIQAPMQRVACAKMLFSVVMSMCGMTRSRLMTC
jgi:hypothetical protein